MAPYSHPHDPYHDRYNLGLYMYYWSNPIHYGIFYIQLYQSLLLRVAVQDGDAPGLLQSGGAMRLIHHT